MLPDDPQLEDMDPFMKTWMYVNWLEDFEDEKKMLDNQGYLVGSFINPEMVKKILGHGSETFASSDEEFEKTSQMVAEASNKIEEEKQKSTRKRKRKIKQ